MAKNRIQLEQVLYEIKSYGSLLRVAAIDPHTGIETYVTGPVHMGEIHLKHNAKRKLEYIITKKIEERMKNR